MREIEFVIEPAANNGWTAKNISEAIVASAESMEELRAKIREAVNWRFVREDSPVIIKLKIAKDRVILS